MTFSLRLCRSVSTSDLLTGFSTTTRRRASAHLLNVSSSGSINLSSIVSVRNVTKKSKLPKHAAVNPKAADIQESLKILQFRFGHKVGFRPVIARLGVPYYRVDGKLRAESEIVSFVELSQPKSGGPE